MPRKRPAGERAARLLAALWCRRGPGACLLWPLSLVFGALVAMRRWLYRTGWLAVGRLPVPVVIIGNLSVGGVGKTPLVIALAEALRRHGRTVGVVARGYGRAGGPKVCLLDETTSPAVAGDEPLLVRRRTGVPVAVGADRVAAARTLLAAHPRIDLILADDGLQHYRLPRALEIVVYDSRGFGNGWLLPAGPLREPLRRLGEADALVVHGGGPVPPAPSFSGARFALRLRPAVFQALDGSEALPALALAHRYAGVPLHAVAGIGDPARFFGTLAALGLTVLAHPFPDHHPYVGADLAFASGVILTTEKDAVKFSALQGALALPVWVLPVSAEVEPDLAAFVLEHLDGPPPA